MPKIHYGTFSASAFPSLPVSGMMLDDFTLQPVAVNVCIDFGGSDAFMP